MKIPQMGLKTLAQRNSMFLGVLVVLVLVTVGVIAVLHGHGFFHPWLNLGNPLEFPEPGERVVNILSASPRSVRVGTNYSRAFETDLPWISWNRKPDEFSWRWNETTFESTNPTLATFGCPFTFWVPPLIPTLFFGISDLKEVRGCRMYVGIEQANFVILKNGTI